MHTNFLGAISLSIAMTGAVIAQAPAVPAIPANTAAPVAAAASSTPATAPNNQQVIEKHLISTGYKPEMQRGQKVFCRKEQIIGSHLGATKVCGTADELTLAEHNAREYTEQVQRSTIPQSGK